ncbi:MAG: hypothetical protein PGN29_09225 [Gordonia paraffinivorans]
MRRVAALVPLAAAVLALAACSSSDDSAAVAESSSSTTTPVISSAPTSTEPTTEAPTDEPVPQTQVDPSAEATATFTAAPAPADDVDCSLATPEALLQAVRPTEIYTRMVTPVEFIDIRCAGAFAVGRSAPPDTQGADVLFRRENGRWVALDLGSAIDYARWGASPDEVSRLIR